jgi:hypothetical protein
MPGAPHADIGDRYQDRGGELRTSRRALGKLAGKPRADFNAGGNGQGWSVLVPRIAEE